MASRNKKAPKTAFENILRDTAKGARALGEMQVDGYATPEQTSRVQVWDTRELQGKDMAFAQEIIDWGVVGLAAFSAQAPPSGRRPDVKYFSMATPGGSIIAIDQVQLRRGLPKELLDSLKGQIIMPPAVRHVMSLEGVTVVAHNLPKFWRVYLKASGIPLWCGVDSKKLFRDNFPNKAANLRYTNPRGIAEVFKHRYTGWSPMSVASQFKDASPEELAQTPVQRRAMAALVSYAAHPIRVVGEMLDSLIGTERAAVASVWHGNQTWAAWVVSAVLAEEGRNY